MRGRPPDSGEIPGRVVAADRSHSPRPASHNLCFAHPGQATIAAGRSLGGRTGPDGSPIPVAAAGDTLAGAGPRRPAGSSSIARQSLARLWAVTQLLFFGGQGHRLVPPVRSRSRSTHSNAYKFLATELDTGYKPIGTVFDL